MQLRVEAQDAMNHAVFGVITANAAPEQRRINVAAKFTW